ncbi:MAG TPA: glycosyltransferase family 2 protein [Candidatus Cybelea sp.]|nr:glycosyltransferase family 2 protein [Candidatus Cybelea sp.]
MAQLSVVIPVYDNWWLTARCLSELARLHRSGCAPFETIVVDNASTDETPEAIAAFPWVRYLRHETNRNFAGACNAGARAAGAPLVLFLNNDAYPLGDALTPLVAAFERPEVTVAGGALFFEDGATQAAGLVLLRNAHWHYSCRNLPSSLDGVTTSRDALGVSGAAMAVRTQWFLDSGGFDESFVNGFEDVDLCLRARERGDAISYVAEARFAHYEGASAGRFDRERENEGRFYQRWMRRLGSLPRTQRGEVGAITMRENAREDPLIAAAREDLVSALRSFGHPVVRGPLHRRRWFDRRFRQAASIEWFSREVSQPGIAIERRAGAFPSIRTLGAIGIVVPWLPCAAPERATVCTVARSSDPTCITVGLAGLAEDVRDLDLGYPVVRVTPEMLLGGGERVPVACVVHGGLTDDAAFGNVLLAQAGVPAIVLPTDGLRAIFASDVALFAQRSELLQATARFVNGATLREWYGRLVAADSRRRFSPRRSAIRVVDLLCAARFGLERPATARANTPL